MRVAVTGGAGFIGANLVRRLQVAGALDSITVIDDYSTTGRRQNFEATTEVRIAGRSSVRLPLDL